MESENNNSQINNLKGKYMSSIAVYSKCIRPYLELINEEIMLDRGANHYNLLDFCENERKKVEHYRNLMKNV
jgi:hypothetical protein